MKRLVWIGILVLMTLAGCHTPTKEARRMVTCAERLAETLPDSTIRLIDSVLHMPVNFSERERMDIALLQAEAMFSCINGMYTINSSTLSPIMDDDFLDDHSTISTSPELEHAAPYYAKKKMYKKAAHAALYSGFVQQHYNEKETAMQSFKDADQYGRLSIDSFTVAQAQYRIGKMLINDGAEQEALRSLTISEEFIGNHFGERALIENNKAVAYMVMNQYDSVELCLRESSIYAEKGGSNKIKRKTSNNYSVLYRLQGKNDQAIACLQQMVCDTSLNDSERLILYLNLGKTYFKANEVDSAARYYQRVEEILSSTDVNNVKKETKLSAYRALSDFAERQNNAPLALQYRVNHENVLYDVMILRQNQTIYRIQRQYDYESLQNVMNRKIIQRHFTIMIISILLLIATIIVLVLQVRHKQLLKSEKEMKQQLDVLKQDLSQTVKSSVFDQEISSRLRLIILAQRTALKENDPKKEWQPLVMKIMNGKDDSFEAARSVLETAYPLLYSTIKENYPNLTETEAKVCLLSCSDLSNTEIAELLRLSVNTVNQNRSNLRKKLNLKPERMKEQLRTNLNLSKQA